MPSKMIPVMMEMSLEPLGLSQRDHPLLWKHLCNGVISLDLFHEDGDSTRRVNINICFNLLERALARPEWRANLLKIAAAAARRKKYTRQITNYLAFLFHIEEYLDEHAWRPGGWRAEMRFVHSTTDFHAEHLVPFANNQMGVVTIPYISLEGSEENVCYSSLYFLARKGLVDPLDPRPTLYEHDLVEKLDGRSYGLCLYTLIGMERYTGSPTFLIAFERRTARWAPDRPKTSVFFYRVHPSRKQGQTHTDTHPRDLITRCYKYRIRYVPPQYQQGNLLLYRIQPVTPEPVGKATLGVEGHAFVSIGEENTPIRLTHLESNPLFHGVVHAPCGMRVLHADHDPIDVEPGWYEVHMARIWKTVPVFPQ